MAAQQRWFFGADVLPWFTTLAVVLGMVAGVVMPSGARAQMFMPEPMMPVNVEGGVQFAIKAPGSEAAYVAGDFNDFCEAENGVITKHEYRMDGPDADGVFRITYPLTPGVYRFQYVLEKRWTDWLHVHPGRLPVASDGNNILTIQEDGRVVPEGFPYVYPPSASRSGIEFRVYAPNYSTAYIAGNFNNWANHRGGTIRETQFQMYVAPNNEFMRVVPLPAGVYQYMICLDGRADRWLPGSSALPQDETGMRYFTVTNRGTITELLELMPLPPRATPDGVEFRVYAPTTQSVFLAGSFNEWAENDAGRVTKSDYAMRPDSSGLFTKTLKLEPGEYAFKYVINGAPDRWIPVDTLDLPADIDGNSKITVQADGLIAELVGKPDPWTEGGLAARLAEAAPGSTRAMRASDTEVAASRNRAAADVDFERRLSDTLESASGKPRVLLFFHPQSAPSIEILSWLESTRGREFMTTHDVLPTDVSKQQATARRYRVFRVPSAILIDEAGNALNQVNFSGTREGFVEELLKIDRPTSEAAAAR
jgi:hypothetical protein